LQTFERLSVGVNKIIEKEHAVITHDTSPCLPADQKWRRPTLICIKRGYEEVIFFRRPVRTTSAFAFLVPGVRLGARHLQAATAAVLPARSFPIDGEAELG
jgi:hypothetical protein